MPGIEINNLSFKIGDFSITNYSLEIGKGEYFVLTGANGSGKTTLIKLIAGLYSPLSGSIKINNVNVENIPPWERNIGYLPQEGLLFPNQTVKENIQFPLEMRSLTKKKINSAVDEIVDMLDLSELLNRKPQGLSGGEKQKACLARALVCKPDILLLDEPVSAIDEKAKIIYCEKLKALQKRLNITTLHVSHNSIETNLLADRTGIIKSDGLDKETQKVPAGRNIYRLK